MNDKDTIKQLLELRNMDKFNIEEWEKRGLISSNTEIREAMNHYLNDTLDQLLAIMEFRDDSNTKTTLTNMLLKIDELDYDTEELEFLCEWFEKIAQIVYVDIHFELNKVLYGDLAEFI